MGPEGEALLIEGHQATLAIHDRAALADGGGGLGLDGPSSVQQLVALHHLHPGQPYGQPGQACG